MNAPLQLRQVAQWPRQDAAIPGTVALIQMGEAGTPYGSILTSDLVASALAGGGRLQIDAATGAIVFGSDAGTDSGVISIASGEFVFSAPIRVSKFNANFIDAPSITVGGIPVATQLQLDLSRAASVTSFNFRQGDVLLELPDILRAGGAPVRDAHFAGWITAPSVWDTRANDDTVATTNWVHRAIHDSGVSSFNGRTGDIVLTAADISAAAAAGPGYPTAPSPVLGDASNRIATTLFVDESLQDLHLTISDEQLALLTSTYAPLNSPAFTGLPTAPTANPGTSTGQLATTSFVMHAVTASTTGVSSFNTRTGAVTLQAADISGAGGALLNSPAFVGAPTAPTPVPGTNNTVLATTAFVAAAVTAAGGVSSFNGRTGAVSLSLADVTGTGVLASTPLTGVPTAPTASPGTNSTQIATTAFVAASAAAGVTSFMSRTGAVTLTAADVSAAGGALNASPTFTGTPTAPTAAPGTSTTQLATTAFVAAALTAGGGVTTFNGRAGAVTLTLADITGAGGVASATLTTSPLNLAGWTLSSAPVTWNPGDVTGTVTLSNGNLTAAAGAVHSGCRGAPGLNSGKYYWEVTATLTNNTNLGIALSSVGFTITNPAGAACINGINGSIYVNGTYQGTALGTGSGLICFAADLTANLFWVRSGAAGNWNNSGTASPATGVGGFSLAGIATGLLYPWVNFQIATDTVTANFGAAAFTGAVPSGFTAGWGGPMSVAAGTGAGGDQITSLGGIALVPGGGGAVTAPTMTAGNNSTAVATTAFVTGAMVVRSYLAGLVLSTAGSSAAFSVAPGVAADSTSARMMTLAAALAKTTSAWAVGNNSGALDTGTIANLTWYHAFLIMRTDTGVVDVLVSLSVAAPTLPLPYTLFRRIGAMKTSAAGQWTKFIQTGDVFQWDVAVTDVSNATPGTSTQTLYTLSVAPGLKVQAILSMMCTATAQLPLFGWDPDTTSAPNAGFLYEVPSANGYASGGINRMMTNVSAQIMLRNNSASVSITSLNVYTFGWVDRRGRDA